MKDYNAELRRKAVADRKAFENALEHYVEMVALAADKFGFDHGRDYQTKLSANEIDEDYEDERDYLSTIMESVREDEQVKMAYQKMLVAESYYVISTETAEYTCGWDNGWDACYDTCCDEGKYYEELHSIRNSVEEDE